MSEDLGRRPQDPKATKGHDGRRPSLGFILSLSTSCPNHSNRVSALGMLQGLSGPFNLRNPPLSSRLPRLQETSLCLALESALESR